MKFHVQVLGLEQYVAALIQRANVRADVAGHLAAALMQASVRGVDSHGVRLLPHYLRALQAGRINPAPAYVFTSTAPATGRLDADHTFGHAAGAEAMKHAVVLARHAGVGAVAVHNSSHFGAAAYFSFVATDQDMIGLSFTQTDALIVSPGGVRAFLGNSPLCFAAPVEGEGPMCLDMATSVVTFNKIRAHAANSEPIPPGWGYDAQGVETCDPAQACFLAPTGGYKGFGLSLMIEVLCSLLTGTKYGPDILKMFAGPIGKKRELGHFFMAIDIARFVPVDLFKRRLREMMDRLRQEPRFDPDASVMCAGDPEKRHAAERARQGVPFSRADWDDLARLGIEYGVPAPSVREVSDE